MRLKNLDLIVVMGIAVMNVVWALIPVHITMLGIILAFPLVFVLPGYTLTETLFRKGSLTTSDRLLFSLGLSVALDVLSGFVLNILPSGLQALSWAEFLGVLAVVFSLLAAYLRRGTLLSGIQFPKFRLSLAQSLLFGLAAVVALISVFSSIVGAEQQPYPGFTQLWILPAPQTGQGCAVRIGIDSFESNPITYRVIMTMNMNEAQATTWPSIVLASQQEWKQLVPISLGTPGNIFVEVRLYRLDKPQSVYRQVHLTLHNVVAKGSNICTSG